MTSRILSVAPARLEVLVAGYQREVARRRRQSLLVLAIVAVLIVIAGKVGEVDPNNLVQNISNFTSYFSRILPRIGVTTFGADVADWYWNITGWLKLLLDTVMIAYLGTLIGAGGAVAMSFLAAANLAPTGILRWSIKRVFEFCRTVPDLVFALMFVSAFGLGPLAGILSIAIHSFGTLGKLFTEAIENIDMKPVEGVRSTGGRFMETVRFGALPQVISTFASYALLRFEINVRSGSVVGMVGAGGIGQDLFVAIRKFYYTDVSAILLMIIVCVAVIDLLTERIRHRLSGGERLPMTKRLYPSDARAVLERHGGLFDSSPLQRASAFAVPVVLAALTIFSIWWLAIPFNQIGSGLASLAKFFGLMFPPSTGGHLTLLVKAMEETLAIAFLGTLIATVMAFPVSFFAASNTTPRPVIRFVVRRALDTIRSVDALIWALVFVGVVGLGPFAGILAIAVSDTGALGKLFSEAIESTDARGRESVLASGGTEFLSVRFGLLPQVLPIIAGQILYFFESNVRSATIIGIVGAGGIGLQLSEQIRTYDFDQVAFAIIMILITVAVIDLISGKLRFAIIGRRAVTD